jgi:hypothetical protein
LRAVRLTAATAAAFCFAVISGATAAGESDHGYVKRDADCADFPSQAAAQHYFIAHGGPSSDPDGLDADHDGIACESNPAPYDHSTGGGGGGGGSTPNPQPAPPPTIKKKLCGKFVGIHGSKVCMKAVSKGGKLLRVEDFRFSGLPAVCSGGTKPKIAGKQSKIGSSGKKFRTRHPRILGGFSHLDANVVGKVSGGKKARGTVRVRAQNNAGAPCDTRGRKWKAN